MRGENGAWGFFSDGPDACVPCRAGAGNGRSVTKFDGCRDLSGGALFISAVSYPDGVARSPYGARFARVGVYDRLPPLIRCAGGGGCLAPPGNRAACRDPAYLRARMWFAWLSYPAAISSSTVGRSSSDTVMLFACAGAHGSVTGAFHISVRSGGRGWWSCGKRSTTSCPLSITTLRPPRVLSFFRRPGGRVWGRRAHGKVVAHRHGHAVRGVEPARGDRSIRSMRPSLRPPARPRVRRRCQ